MYVIKDYSTRIFGSGLVNRSSSWGNTTQLIIAGNNYFKSAKTSHPGTPSFSF